MDCPRVIIFLNFHRNFLLNTINIELSLDQLEKDWHLYIVEYTRYTYDSLNFREWKTNPMGEKWAINLNRNFTKEDVQKFKNNMKSFLTSGIIGEIKISMRYWYTLTKRLKLDS